MRQRTQGMTERTTVLRLLLLLRLLVNNMTLRQKKMIKKALKSTVGNNFIFFPKYSYCEYSYGTFSHSRDI